MLRAILLQMSISRALMSANLTSLRVTCLASAATLFEMTAGPGSALGIEGGGNVRVAVVET